MKTAITLATSILMAALTAPAIAESKIPHDLNQDPEKFCFVAGVISAGIMDRTDAGYPREYMYSWVNKLEQPQLRAFLNETVTLADQFAKHSSEPVDKIQFATWNCQRCMAIMAPSQSDYVCTRTE
jgi:hypothetical protein